MAFPEKLSDVNTNLSEQELAKVAAALENEDPKIVWGEGSLFAGDRIEHFFYDGKQYRIFESFELVISINEMTE